MEKVNDIFASMVGESIQPLEGIPNEYAPGSYCDQLYGEACAARNRLCQRLGVYEDADLELIFDNLYDINAYLCRQMFIYGVIDGKS